MYYVKKTVTVSSSHRLMPPYEGKCCNYHGHNWRITVRCAAREVDALGMVVDFSHIKKIVERLDHVCVNDVIEQPTAENIARAVWEQVPLCYRVDVEETEGSVATYINTSRHEPPYVGHLLEVTI